MLTVNVVWKEVSEIWGSYQVLAQGISEAECIELTQTTPMSAYRASAFAEATGSDGLNFNVLAHKLVELNLMRDFGLIKNNDLERDED